MLPQHQQFFVVDGVSRGDCWRACIASMTETPITLVPHFILFASWWRATQMWLTPQGFEINGCTRGSDEQLTDGELVIITGTSPRDFSHVVIARVNIDAPISEWEIVHDPHPLGGGLRNHDDLYYRITKVREPVI